MLQIHMVSREKSSKMKDPIYGSDVAAPSIGSHVTRLDT